MFTFLKKILFYRVSEKEINYGKFNSLKRVLNMIKNFFKKIPKFLFLFIVTIASLFVIEDYLYWNYDFDLFSGDEPSEHFQDEYYDCNVAAIELHGFLSTYITPDSIGEDGSALYDETASEYLVSVINEASRDRDIRAIILEIDSYGGHPVAAEEVADALRKTNKPTVALIREGGTSAAYWAATGADTIFASHVSDVGGIGVTYSYLDYSKKNEREGLVYNSVSTGQFKDYGDPNKPLTPAERQLLMRDLNITNEHFMKTISENRELDMDKVRKLADGSSMPGVMALEEGLIDRIGNFSDVKDYLSELINQDVEVCWY